MPNWGAWGGIVLAGLFGLCSGLAARPALAADPALVAAAEREGQLMLYDCDIPETPPQVKRFSELYPKIKVSTYVAGCWQMYNRYAGERAAGKMLADVTVATDDAMMKMDSDGWLEGYESPELPNFPKDAHPAGSNFFRYKVVLAILTANTDAMKGVPVPADWLDYANPLPQWTDKISFYDPRTSALALTVLASLYQNLGPEKAGTIYEGLRKSNASLAATTPGGLAMLLSGERPIMFYILTNQLGAMKAKGAPLSVAVAKSGAVATYFDVAVLKGTPHPNAARLFSEFLLTDGQRVVSERADYAYRNDAPTPEGLPALKDIKIMPTDFRKMLADQAQLIAWWQDHAGVH
jgi:iron(III) transport system substrate-binding protein